ncbi:MAG: prephenate dehydratase [Armatimonadetes bacterium]|nr:prephenate dehydratase [Armatimonadota bacterium]
MDPNLPDLPSIRDEIDRIDADLVRLLSRRAECARMIGQIKGLDGKPFFTPERERHIYNRLREINPGPLLPEQLSGIFREIISAARAVEKQLSIAYWGPPGTFTHMAARQTFGASADYTPVETISDTFAAVERGHCDYGVVPIENSVGGVVPETLDGFPVTNVKICAETYIMVRHHLASHAPDLASIQRVYAGPQPWQQCRRWLRDNLPHAEVVEVVPTSRAALQAAKDPNGAAIANPLGAEEAGLPLLHENIHDLSNNRTRFLVIGYNEPAKTGNDKTSLLFNLRNRPGELYRALGALEMNGVNLTMIESRPAPRTTFEYIFYVDCAGHRSDEQLQVAIQELKGHALETVVLGSYPSAEPASG